MTGRGLRGTVLAVVAVAIVLPILAGQAETARAAGGADWPRVLALPGLGRSVALTLWVGLAATALSVALAAGLGVALHGRAAGRLLAPLLAAPHAAVAIGLGFLIAPSGWIARLMAAPMGWDRPPDVATVGDPTGLALIAGLAVKEVPFLTLVLLSALAQVPVRATLAAGRALGYRPGAVWAKLVLPQVWPLVRLPVAVVLAFGLSVVDMALILGPGSPPTLPVMVLRAYADGGPGTFGTASALALLQGGVVLAGLALGWAAAAGLRAAGRGWVTAGARGGWPGLRLAGAAAGVLMAAGFLSLGMLALWSVAFRWPFPALLPETLTLRGWTAPMAPLGTTLALGLAATLAALVLAILWLEAEDRGRMTRARWAEALVYLPLLLPQIAFLYGLTVVLLKAGGGFGWVAVVWGHALFVFPYVMLSLSDPWRAMDARHARSASALGAGPWRVLWAVKLPVLLRPVLTAAAVGFSVSCALYLPTLFLGGGRIATLTTEAVTLSSGSDRRLVGVLATLQSALPLLGFVLAVAVPAAVWRHRAGLRGA
jgi:putative thiamine transport system permease protein